MAREQSIDPLAFLASALDGACEARDNVGGVTT
jgi:hypothetical protein